MKFVFVLLCVAIIFQVSQAGTIGRSEGNDGIKQELKVFYEKLKLWMEKADTIVKGVVKDLPTTKEYSEYKQNLESFLETYEDHKENFEGCFVNLYKVSHELADMYRPYEQDDASPEAKEVRQLFYKHGLKEIEDDAGEFFKTFNKETMKEAVDLLTPEEKKAMMGNCNSFNAVA